MRAGRLGSGHPILFSLVAAVAALALHSAHAADPAQKVARVAFISPYSPATTAPGSLEFWARLRELGWVQGQNLIVETRYAEGAIDRLPAIMADVVALKVDVIVTRGTPAAIAATPLRASMGTSVWPCRLYPHATTEPSFFKATV